MTRANPKSLSATPTRVRLPYYLLREAIERKYDRRRRLWKDIIWGWLLLIAALFMAEFGWIQLPPMPDNQIQRIVYGIVLFFVLLLLWTTIVVLLVVLDLTIDMLNIGDREEELVMRCVAFIDEHSYDPATLNALAVTAAQGSTNVQMRSLLPIALLAAIATASAIQNLPLAVGVIFSELAILILLNLAVIIGNANTDTIIQKALIERQRRDEQLQYMLTTSV